MNSFSRPGDEKKTIKSGIRISRQNQRRKINEVASVWPNSDPSVVHILDVYCLSVIKGYSVHKSMNQGNTGAMQRYVTKAFADTTANCKKNTCNFDSFTAFAVDQ
jgi:hypothetical protein